MTKLILYSDSARELTAYDTRGFKWDGFHGSGYYRFECGRCHQIKSNGWVKYGNNVEEVCTECAMVVYNLAEIIR